MEKFEWLRSSEQFFYKILYPKILHCCEAPRSMISNYFDKKQVLKGTFGEIWRIQIQMYPQTSFNPKYGAFNLKTRRGSPVDDKPSTDKLNHFVRKKKKKKNDTWHVTRDTWHVTRDTWHVTCDTWYVWGGEHSLKISAL